MTASATIPNTDITGLGTMSTQNSGAVTITGGTITGLSSAIPVPSGGTGATTLTGYVKGNGTSLMTASATIPNTDITGLGTMSTQGSDAVTITGGTANGLTIGASNPAAATVTTLRINSTLSLAGATGTSGQVLTSNGASAPTWQSVAGVGTVTSVDVSGGTTGLTTSGGPVTSSGTITLAGTLAAVNGGTGQSSYVVGDVLYASTTTALSKLTIGTAGQVLTVAAGIPSWATPTTGTVTSVSFTGGVVSVATATTTPALTIAGTSGGIPYFSSATTWATSAALAASALVIGGGAGVAPSTITTGTGVVTALGVNVGSAGALITFNGALGTPSSGTVTNLTGTASININGTVGATTPSTGAFTTLTSSTSFTPTAYTETIVASGTVGSTATLAITAGTILTATLTSATACTFTMPTATAGKSFTLLLKQPAAGSATTATFTSVKWNSSGAPTITATLGKLDIIAFVADGTNWYGTASQGYTY